MFQLYGTFVLNWGIYNYCRVPRNRQLSPFKVGEDDSNWEQKNLRKNQLDQYGQTTGCYKGFKAFRVQTSPRFWAS